MACRTAEDRRRGERKGQPLGHTSGPVRPVPGAQGGSWADVTGKAAAASTRYRPDRVARRASRRNGSGARCIRPRDGREHRVAHQTECESDDSFPILSGVARGVVADPTPTTERRGRGAGRPGQDQGASRGRSRASGCGRRAPPREACGWAGDRGTRTATMPRIGRACPAGARVNAGPHLRGGIA